MTRYHYTDEEFINAVNSSISIRQVLIKLGLAPQGGNYRTIHNRIKLLDLNTSHMLGQAHYRNQTIPDKTVDIQEYLLNKRFIQSHKLKKRLIKEGLKQHKCEVCKLDKWNNNLIPLELHHKDGNYQNNSFDNLQLLCPNCHATTSTYRSRNRIQKV